VIKITVRQIIIVVVIGLGYVLPSIIFANIGVFKDMLIGFIASSIIYFVTNFIFKVKLDKKIPFIFGIIIIFLGAVVVYFCCLNFQRMTARI
jgi:hypothetical protein